MLRVTIRYEGGEKAITVPVKATVAELLQQFEKETSVPSTNVTLLVNGDVVLDPANVLATFVKEGQTSLFLDAIVSGVTAEQRLQTVQARLQAQAGSEDVDMRGAFLGPQEAERLTAWLMTNPNVRALYLSDNSIGDDGVEFFKRFLQTNPNLFVLSLNSNNISDRGLTLLAEALLTNMHLAVLELAGNHISVEGVRTVKKVLEQNHTVTYLLVDSKALDASSREVIRPDGIVVRNVALRDALHEAIRCRDIRKVSALLDAGADAWGLNTAGENVLHMAVRSGLPQMLDVILRSASALCRLNHVNADGRTPLHLACELNASEFVARLIRRGSRLLAQDYQGLMPFEIRCGATFRVELRQMFINALTQGKVFKDAVNLLHKVCPDVLQELFGQYAVVVTLAAANDPPLALPWAKQIFSCIEKGDLLGAIDRLEAQLKEEEDADVRLLYGICGALLDHDDAVTSLASANSLNTPLTSFSDVVRRDEKNPKRVCGAAVAYLLSKSDDFPASWTSKALAALDDLHQAAFATSRAPVPGSASQVQPQSAAAVLATRWSEVRRKYPSQTKNMEKLMKMTGLASVKDTVLGIFEQIELVREQRQKLNEIPLHARFEGNPGTGKTTVLELYAEILKDAGVLKKTAVLHRTTGTKLKIEGIGDLQDLLKKMMDAGGGVLFVDEAYQLDPASDPDGRKILDTIMDEMEARKGELVVVIAGYRKHIEKLIEYNPGLPSRFPQQFVFQDYTDDELLDMLTKQISDKGFRVSDPKWCRIAVKRLGRRRGKDGFGNARDVRNLVDQSLTRQRQRITEQRRQGSGDRADVMLLERDDLLGPKASRESLLRTCKAYEELQKLHGLQSVKRTIDALVNIAVQNAELEDREEPVADKLNLNRVFLGNPGTGKTTVAKLYGEILSHLGLLSKREVVFKTASDFNGTVIGESTKVAASIIESARGCVLVIDEAYALDPQGGFSGKGDPYKAAVIDTIVEKVQVGDDIAVVLLGYKKQMEDMLRNANSGLARRFNLDDALFFEDYDDEALFRILGAKAKAAGLKLSLQTQRAAVKILARQRNLPNFGNAGAIDNLLGNARVRMQKRLADLSAAQAAAQKELNVEDFDCPHDVIPPTDEELGPELAAKRTAMENVIANARRTGRDFSGDIDFNFLFVGPPGTGKTTGARLVGRMMRSLGVLQDSEVIEAQASDFVTGYAQQAAKRTEEIFQKALGKVLFIDEAYSLRTIDPMGEVMNAICGLMTRPEYKGKMVVILAGYDREMGELIKSNSGLESRFRVKIHFEPWDARKSARILGAFLSERDLTFSPDAEGVAEAILQEAVMAPNWSSGRDVEGIGKSLLEGVRPGVTEVDAALLRHAVRKLVDDRTKTAAIGSNAVVAALPRLQSQSASTSAPVVATATAVKEVQQGGDDLPRTAQGADGCDWYGMDIKTEVTPLSDALEEFGWAGEQKIEELSKGNPDSDADWQVLIRQLQKKGVHVDVAKQIVKKWIIASEKMRRDRYEAEVQAKLKNRKPIIQCQVCKSTANYWAPCYVAPMQIGWEEVEIAAFKGRRGF